MQYFAEKNAKYYKFIVHGLTFFTVPDVYNIFEEVICTEVYADLMFLINFSMDFLCFYITAKLLHEKLTPWRVILSSAVGGVYSVAVLFFELGNITAVTVDIAVCILINVITFMHRHGRGRVLLCSGVYFCVSALLGGCMTALYSLFNKSGVSDGAESDGIGVWVFVLLASVSSVSALWFGKIFRRSVSARTCELTVSLLGVTAVIPGICDSGNLLHDPVSGKPVAVIDVEYAKKLLPIEVFDAVINCRYSDGCLSGYGYADRFRLIPADTATGGGIMVAFRPDKMSISDGRKIREVDALFAIANLKGAKPAALIPSELMV